MTSSGDPAIAAATEYERATLNALLVLEQTDRASKQAACLRFVKALGALRALSRNDQMRASQHIARRGLIPENASRTIQAAMDALSR